MGRQPKNAEIDALADFVWALSSSPSQLDASLRARVRAAARNKRMVQSAKRYTVTNCGWATYQAAQLILEAAKEAGRG